MALKIKPFKTTEPVNLKGLPEELVTEAEWVQICDEKYIQGNRVEICRQAPKINGVVVDVMSSEEDTRKFINMFPRIPSMLPMTEEEMTQVARTGKRPAEIVNINGARYTIPKGVIFHAPLPIATLVENMINPIRTNEMQAQLGNENYSPLGNEVPFEL